MKQRLPYLPWFPRDFMSSTRGWSVTEKGVYRELLDAQWDMGTLAEDPAELRRLIGAGDFEWSAGWARCGSKFPIVEGGGRRNARLEIHRSKSFRVSEVRREVGRRGGQASAAARGEPIAQPIGEDTTGSSTGGDVEAIATPIAQAKVNHPTPSLKNQNKNPAAPANASESEDQDPDDYLIWTAGIELLGESKRSLMGKLVKIHGRDLIARKLGELMAMPEKPRDPAAYFIGVMRKLERRFQA